MAGSDAFFIKLLSISAKTTIFFGRIGSIGSIGCAGFLNRGRKEVDMVCRNTSRLKIGPMPDAKGRGCPSAKWGRIEMRIPGLKAREVMARGEAQRSPGERPAIYPRPVRPEHRCTECAGLSGLGISAPPDPGPPGRAVTSQVFGPDTSPGDRCRPHSRPGWFRSERCRRYALPP